MLQCKTDYLYPDTKATQPTGQDPDIFIQHWRSRPKKCSMAVKPDRISAKAI